MLILAFTANAQLNTQKEYAILLKKKITIIDSLPIDIQSFYIVNYRKNIDYTMDSGSVLSWKKTLPEDSIYIKYRNILIPKKIVFNKKEGQIIHDGEQGKLYKVKGDSIVHFTSNDNLKVIGNIGRNLGFGNQQDLAVNSDMNIQIMGTLNNDVEISASISDNTYPIQPEGNTRQIQQFDNVFVKLKKGNSQLLLGDHFNKSDTAGRFLKFNKKNRGVKLNTQWNDNRHILNASIAQARGRFMRNIIVPIEGIQGPYRLSGPNNQVYIVVVAGTENVYVDGKKLQRGLDDDYIIDYNTGEVTFMPKVLITTYSRIIVQFQYSDREYERSIYHGAYHYQNKRLKVLAQTFLEQDNRFKPFQQSLDIFDSASQQSAYDILQNAGDNSDQSVIRSVNSLAVFNPNGVNYIKKDSAGFQLFLFADTADKNLRYYTVNFTFVGQGKGDYNPTASFGNGKVYKWIKPIAGIKQGSYLPVVKISVPKRKMMQTLKMQYFLGKLGSISSEVAYSSYDKNLLSTKNDENNNGFATYFTWETKQKLNKKNLLWNSKLTVEHTQKEFEKIEQYRSTEFYRSWYNTLQNPDGELLKTDENILDWNQYFLLAKGLKLTNVLRYYKAVSAFDGYSNNLGLQYQDKKWNATINWNEQNNKQQILKGNFKEYSGSLSRTFAKLYTLGTSSQWIESRHTNNSTSLLENSSYSFFDNSVYLQKTAGKYWAFRTSFNHRSNDQSDTGVLKKLNVSTTVGFSANYMQKHTQFSITLNQRNIDYNLDHSKKLDNKNTLLGQLNFTTKLWKESVILRSKYILNNGRQAKQQISYLKVPQGNGYYAWNDYNNNGIQELNEFTRSLFKDKANFVRLILPTNEFVNVSLNEFYQTLNFSPPETWKSKKGVLKVFSKFSNYLTFTAKRNISSNDWEKVLNPFYTQTSDTAFTGLNTSLNNRFFYNRNDVQFGGTYQYFTRKNALFLAEGTDVSAAAEQWIELRYAPKPYFTLKTEARLGNHSLLSRNFNVNNYNFDFKAIKPKLEFIISKYLNIHTEYHYRISNNAVKFGAEKAEINTVSAGFTYSKSGKTTLGGNFSHIRIDYNGANGTALAYDIMAGFAKGNNAQWELNLSTKFNKNIQITLGYQGRNSEDSPNVHYGQARARYLF